MAVLHNFSDKVYAGDDLDLVLTMTDVNTGDAIDLSSPDVEIQATIVKGDVTITKSSDSASEIELNSPASADNNKITVYLTNTDTLQLENKGIEIYVTGRTGDGEDFTGGVYRLNIESREGATWRT